MNEKPELKKGILSKWLRRSALERALLLEAFFLLGVARLALLTLPFKWIAGSLGNHMKESKSVIEAFELEYARKVGQAVRSAANYTPWQSVCLPQAVAGLWMLRRRGIASTLYFGVQKDPAHSEKLSAHAWLRCGTVILTGRPGMEQFTVVSHFATEEPAQ